MTRAIATLSLVTLLLAGGCGVNQRRGVVEHDEVAGLRDAAWKVEHEPAAAPTGASVTEPLGNGGPSY